MGAKKTVNNTREAIMDIPESLIKHPFYGLVPDEQQRVFRDSIWDINKLIIFCNAFAGTGKTTIATATADLLCQHGLYRGITYIAAPTQEQKQGYLKGSLEEKSEPYFMPFYQALNKNKVKISTSITDDLMNMKNGTGYITCMTHTFLRGINFEHQVVIIDEAQNFTTSELQKVLTRIHDNCKVIIIGHTGQVDISVDETNGFEEYIKHYKDDPRTAICSLETNYRGWISSWADQINTRKKS